MSQVVDPVQLVEAINTYYDVSELGLLCFELGIDYESLDGRGKLDNARHLVTYARRHNRYDDLVAYVRRTRPHASLKLVDASLVSPFSAALITNLPLANPHFTGRSHHLQRLAAGSGAMAITQTIAGLGGVGKSQLMLAFAHEQRDAYDIVWWLRVDEALVEDYLALGRQLQLAVDGLEQAAAVQLVRNWLNGSEKRWLLLCDNADVTEPRALLASLPHSRHGRIVITSRNPHWQRQGPVLRLDVFTEAETAAFWDRRLGEDEAEAVGRAELAAELGYLPLALEQAAAYVEVNGLAAATYQKLYRTQRQALWDRATPPDDYHATITTTWELAFTKARETAGAAELLNLCCFLAADDIPLALLREHAQALPDELATVLSDPLALNDALSALARYSLLARAGGMISLHRLVQMVARDQMGEERAKVWAEAAVELLGKAYHFDQHDMITWVACGQLMPHLTTVTGLAAELEVNTSRAAFLNNEAGYYLRYYGQLREARPYYERALSIWEKVLGPNHPDTATSLNNLGVLLRALGQLEAAQPYYKRALSIREKVLDSDHPHIAQILNNLGHLLQAMGQLGEARLYYERALAIWEKALGPDHPDMALTLNNMGHLLHAMGQLGEAHLCYERALAICEKALGPDHPDVALTLNNLGGLLHAMGRLEAAWQYYERALAIREEVLGPEHPDTAQSLNNLGYLLDVMGQLRKAGEYYGRALVIQEKVLGPDHLDMAYTLNNLGTLSKVEGNLAQARVYLGRALAVCEGALGVEHPTTKVVRGNLEAVGGDGGLGKERVRATREGEMRDTTTNEGNNELAR